MGPYARFVRTGTLDQPHALTPDIHVFTESKVPWVQIPAAHRQVPQFYRSEQVWSAAVWLAARRSRHRSRPTRPPLRRALAALTTPETDITQRHRSQVFPRLSEREYRTTLSRIEAALAQSDEIILGRFRRARIQHKPDGSEVTEADRGAEQRLRRVLRTTWPADPILGEEFGGELVHRGRCWLLDPIDGTASYVLGVPMFGTLISLLIDGSRFG